MWDILIASKASTLNQFYKFRSIGLLIIVLSLIGLAANIYSFAVTTSIIEMIIRLLLASTNYIGLFFGVDWVARTKLMSFRSQYAELIMTINDIRNRRCEK